MQDLFGEVKRTRAARVDVRAAANAASRAAFHADLTAIFNKHFGECEHERA